MNTNQSSRFKELERILLLEYTKPHGKRVHNYQQLQEEYEQMRAPKNTHMFMKRENADAERIQFEREEESYKPFAQRQRSHEQNYEYVLQYRDKVMYRISKEAETAALEQNPQLNLDDLKREEDIALYNNLSYNFFNHQYDTSLPIFSKKREVKHLIFGLYSNNSVINQPFTDQDFGSLI
jgi:hypothetical protein